MARSSDRLADLTEVLALLERAGAPCLVFGGWAEELLGLRAPGPHRDIDLVHLSNAFATVDMGFERRRLPAEIRPKRFPHKAPSAGVISAARSCLSRIGARGR
jgi:hypothetical protein